MKAASIGISAVGMACPIGLTASSACAAMRAGINRRRELTFLDDESRPIIGSALPLLPPDMPASWRWLSLLDYSLKDLSNRLSPGSLRHVPIILTISDDLSACVVRQQDVVGTIRSALGIDLHPDLIQIIKGGSSSGYRAIARARALLSQGRYRACVVSAADSLLDARRLLALHERRRLLSDDNPDGVTPGEAAACLLLGSPLPERALILGLGFAKEYATLANEAPVQGEGATAAARMALAEAGLPMREMDVRFSDAAGESFSFKEIVLMTTRLLRERKAQFPLWLAADQLGDVGAAAGLCNVVQAVIGLERGYVLGRKGIGFAGSECGDRAAIVIEKAQNR